MASRAPTNADLMREIRTASEKLDRVEKFMVGDPFSKESKERSLDGRMTRIEGRMSSMEARLETPPVKQAEQAFKASGVALELGMLNKRNVRAALITAGLSAVAALIQFLVK